MKHETTQINIDCTQSIHFKNPLFLRKCTFGFIYIKMIRKSVKDIDLLIKLSLLDPRNCLKTEDVIRQHALLPPETSAIWLSPEQKTLESLVSETQLLSWQHY